MGLENYQVVSGPKKTEGSGGEMSRSSSESGSLEENLHTPGRDGEEEDGEGEQDPDNMESD